MAFTASSPIFNGILAETDTRWSVISQSVDDRSEQERDKDSPYHIQKSRYDSISYYISSNENKFFKNEYNDCVNYLDPEISKDIAELEQ